MNATLSKVDLTKADIVDVVPGCCAISCWRNISIVVWAGQATLDAVHRCSHISPQLHNRYPEGHSHIAIVLKDVPLPTEEAHIALARSLKNMEQGLMLNAIIIEGEGFWASSLQSTLTGIRIKSGGSAISLWTNIEEMAARISNIHSRRTGITVTEAELDSAVRECRSRSLEALRMDPSG